MNTTLWIVQGLLAVMFFMAGIFKLTKSKDDLRVKLGDWVDILSPISLKIIGLLELLGAIGLIAPLALNILPILTPIAAIGLACTMGVAFMIHLQRKEYKELGTNLILLSIAVFIAIGRLNVFPVI